MPFSPRTLSIGAALLFSVFLVIAAYTLSSPLTLLNRADAQSSEEVLRAYAQKDTDGDGLYDWQEALYGTDPQNPESVQTGVTDSEAVRTGLVEPKFTSEAPRPEVPTSEELDASIGPAPAEGSLTEQFSQQFIRSYLSGNGDHLLDQAAQDAFVQSLLQDFAKRAADQLGSSYTLSAVRQVPSVSVKDYAAALELAVTNHTLTVETADPVTLMDAFLVKGDASARAKIAALGATYSRIRSALLAMEVPPSLAGDHLTMLRAYDTLTTAMEVTARYEEDPLAVMGVLGVYPFAAQGVLEAGANVGRALIKEGDVPAAGMPGSMFIPVMEFVDSL